MTAMDEKHMTDAELDRMLTAAAQPPLPHGFANRLQTRLETPVADNVVAFPQKKLLTAQSERYWLSAIPLAASLAVGLYLGAQGTLADSLSGLGTALVSDATDSLFNTGIEDTVSFINGELS
jgi:hypothetical protein